MQNPHVTGYIYQAGIYCTNCILGQLPTGEGKKFEGWEDLSDQSAEDSLTELAAAFGIDRFSEETFDSSEFPKVIFWDQDEDLVCDNCRASLSD